VAVVAGWGVGLGAMEEGEAELATRAGGGARFIGSRSNG
jgi:hypothetical protein